MVRKTVLAVGEVPGPEFRASSVTEPAASASTTVPSEHDDAVTVKVVPGWEPDRPSVQPVAVPVTERSPTARPMTGSLKVRVEVTTDAFVKGDAGRDHVAAGPPGTPSTPTDEASVFAAGPVLPAASVTDPASRRGDSVPVEQPVTVMFRGDPPDAEVAAGAKTQPVDVPAFAKSPAAMPLTFSLNVSGNTVVPAAGLPHVAVAPVRSMVTVEEGADPDPFTTVIDALSKLLTYIFVASAVEVIVHG